MVCPVSVPPPPRKPPAPRLTLREMLFLAFVAAWVMAVLLTDRALPLTPPVTPYSTVAASR